VDAPNRARVVAQVNSPTLALEEDVCVACVYLAGTWPAS